jgi:Tol biopolymer transport system component
MTTESFDRRLSTWLEQDAQRRVPDHLAEVLVATRATRQRPAWSSLERWLPVELTLRNLPVTMGRGVRIAAVLALLLAAALLAYLVAGGLRARVPSPYGLAENGLIASWRDGDIHVSAPDGTGDRVLIGGPTIDLAPSFSRDGTRLMFLREAEDATVTVMLAASDGTGVRQISGPLRDADWFEWSPAGDAIAAVHAGSNDRRVLSIIDPSGAKPMRTLDLSFSVDNNVDWRAPNGHELVLTGRDQPGDAFLPTVYAVALDGTVRVVAPMAPHPFYYQELRLSADGRMAVFGAFEPLPGAPQSASAARIHVLDLVTGEDRHLDFSPGADELSPAISPDGRRVAFVTDCLGDCGSGLETPAQVMVANIDGTDAVAIGRPFEFLGAPTLVWSPDASMLALIQPDEGSWLLSTTSPGDMTSRPGVVAGWQRVTD